MRQVSPHNPFKTAALAYFVYGCTYLLGAALQMTPDRQHDFYGLPWWSFFVVGAVLVLGMPVLIRQERRRFTQILSVFPAIKALTLVVKQGKLMGASEPTIAYNWFFAAVALTASVLLFRAGFSSSPESSKQQ